MHGDDLLAHGKADAAAAGFGAALVKFELDAGKLFFRDAGAVVPDADDDEAVFMRDGGVDALALAAVLGRIVENVEKHLPHPRHVAGDLGTGCRT